MESFVKFAEMERGRDRETEKARKTLKNNNTLNAHILYVSHTNTNIIVYIFILCKQTSKYFKMKKREEENKHPDDTLELFDRFVLCHCLSLCSFFVIVTLVDTLSINCICLIFTYI